MADENDFKPGDSDNNLLRKILTRLANLSVSGGGGGGGAVTVADGADVAEGAKADSAVTNPASSASVIAALKGVLTRLDVALSTRASEATLATLTNVGGFMASIKDTTAVSASPDYSIGDAVGAKRTLSNAVRTPGTGILEDILIMDRSNQKPGLEIVIFDADPTNATITDNSAFDFSTDDVKVIARISVGVSDYVSIDSTAYAHIKSIGAGLKTASGTTLYAAIIATTPWNAATTSDLQVIYKILQD